MNHLKYQTLLATLALLSSLVTGAEAVADTANAMPAPAALPDWQSLEFEQKNMWITASSTVTVEPCPSQAGNWQLSASGSVARNSEQVELYFNAADGRALWRSRLGQGQEQQRYKSWDFGPEHILRERREPGADPALPPEQWPLTSSRDIAYPPETAERVVTDAYGLLVLADRFQSSAAEFAEVLVNSDFNFYRVRFSHVPAGSKGSIIDVNYQLAGESQPVTGKRDTHGVALTISPVANNPDKADFSLLGLIDNIQLQFDAGTGLLLQLRGDAPKVGSSVINLKAATLRSPAP